MIAYKGFNKNLSCTRGKGIFHYEIGRTYEENAAKCANTGFHCAEEPIEVLTWYSADDARYCIVLADGDINEDGNDKISCTKMTILREVTLQEIGILECQWILEHPERKASERIQKDKGYANDRIVIVRGKNPKAAGRQGTTVFLLQEKKDSTEIDKIGVYEIDGKEYHPDVYYTADGRRVKCGKKN